MSINLADYVANLIAEELTADTDPWEEEPAPLEVFLYDAGYLALPAFSDKQYDFLEQMDDDDPKTNIYTEAVLQWGKGAGKDYISGIWLARRAYKLLCLKSPASYHNLSPGSPIELLNIAYNATQAYTAFFKQFTNTVKDKRCFERYGYEVKNMSVQFGKNIVAYSGHSDKEGQEGLNLYAGVADEISAFKTDHELGLDEDDRGTSRAARVKGAESIVKMLRSSITSRFPKVGKLVLLSYPRYSGDYIQQSYNAGKRLKNVYTSFGATFELRPDISKADLQSEYDRDPIEAASKYECIPPLSKSAYHREEQVIQIFDDEIKNPFRVGTKGEEDSLAPWFHPSYLGIDGDTPCWIHIDLAWKHDAAGFAFGFCESWVVRDLMDSWTEIDTETRLDIEKKGEVVTELRPVVKIPLYTRWKAPPRGEIDLAKPRKLCVQLRQRGFQIRRITFDQYQSVDSRQILRKLGFKTDELSVDKDVKAHQALREVIRDRRFKTHVWTSVDEFRKYRDFYLAGRPDEENSEFVGKTLENIDQLAAELLGLELLNGNKIDHKSEVVGKDMVDACAGVTKQVVEGARKMVEATILERTSRRYSDERFAGFMRY